VKKIADKFEEAGGIFISSPAGISEKLHRIKAFVFDWDGVFNQGLKGPGITGSYSEADSMGTNLLRFSGWLEHESTLPFMAIITGREDPAALELAKREHFNVVYLKALNKIAALDHFMETRSLKPEEIAYTFDDVLDLPLAERCGLRFLVRRTASPLFMDYVINKKLCDYVTARQGGDHAVREITELLLGLSGNFERVIRERTAYGISYQNYLAQRNARTFESFTL